MIPEQPALAELKRLIEAAIDGDADAEATLRRIARSSADAAPVEDLARICEAIYEAGVAIERRHAEWN